MADDKLRLSIITVTYNGAETIRDNLESLRSQAVDFQHVVIDGGSTDGTLEILREKKLPNSIIVSEPDNGIYDAMNKGVQLADGDIIGILNSDDIYAHSQVLQKVMQLFSVGHFDGCYGDLDYVSSIGDKIKRYWRAGEYREANWYRGWMPPHPTFFVKREIYRNYGSFDLGLGSAADYELMLRFVLRHKIRLGYLPEILVRMRVGGVSNSSFKNRMLANRMDKKAWRVNHLCPSPWTFLLKPARKIPQWFVKPPSGRTSGSSV